MTENEFWNDDDEDHELQQMRGVTHGRQDGARGCPAGAPKISTTSDDANHGRKVIPPKVSNHHGSPVEHLRNGSNWNQERSEIDQTPMAKLEPAMMTKPRLEHLRDQG